MTQPRGDYPLDYTKGTGAASNRPQEPADAATDRPKDLGERTQDAAARVGEQAREYAEKAQDAARQFKPFVERSLKEQPMATLAGAAVIGFILGALWKK
jgi:ElaB/YqjD/DUF883 family membrane-anchored ribosome-binding protein